MSVFKFFASKQDRKTAFLQDKLKVILRTKQTVKLNKPELMDLVERGVEAETVDALLTKKRLDFDIKEQAGLLKTLVAARDGLVKGDVEPAYEAYLLGNGTYFFDRLTSGKPTPAKMQAKTHLFEKAYKPAGDHGDPSFNHIKDFSLKQQRQAIEGYAALDMPKECSAAMRQYVKNDVYDKNAPQYIRKYMSGPVSVLSLSAIEVAQEKNMLKLADHLELIKRHPEDAQRIKSINAVVDDLNTHMMRHSKWREEDSLAFDTLIDHMKTPENGKVSSQSQLAAAKAISDNLHFTLLRDRMEHGKIKDVEELRLFLGNDAKLVNVADHVPPTLADKYYDTVFDEARKGSSIALETVFKTGNSTECFLSTYAAYQERIGNKQYKDHAAVLEDVLPRTLEGVGITKTRLHIAEQYSNSVFTSYMRRPLTSPSDNARIAVNLAAHTLMDEQMADMVTHKDKANAVLHKVKQAEDFVISEYGKYKDKPDMGLSLPEGFHVSDNMHDFLNNAGYLTNKDKVPDMVQAQVLKP